MNSATHDASPNYLAIFGILCGLTLVSILADFISLPGGKVLLAAIVLSVATAKALFVMLYFMHLKFEGGWKYALLTPTVILAVGLLIAMLPDIGLHYYVMDVPQVR
ncbi:MAG: cytochrome C oxidase subunit IV family protein [Planctomycetaceae bacterium]|nr:cytochrome C oxidase subunit IV family protein [Planctomycetaceae bacterium]